MNVSSPFRIFAAAILIVLSLAAPALASERLLVLPLQPAEGAEYDGLGPALQNLMENVALLNPAFEETYFLRHSHALFGSAWNLHAYIRGLRPPRFPLNAAGSEGTRFVLGGRVDGSATAVVWLADLSTRSFFEARLPLDADTGLTDFRQGLIDFLDQTTRLPYPPDQAAKALQPEATSLDALKAYGRSYGSYQTLLLAGGRALVDLALAEQAVKEAPRSYLAANMCAWENHVSGRIDQARKLFREALTFDPNGVDALDGMMQLGLMSGGLDAATPWALRKAKARGEDPGPALAQLYNRLGVEAHRRNNSPLAVWYYRKAVALSPDWELSWLNLSWELSFQGRYTEAQQALDMRLKRPAPPATVALFMNRKAAEARLEALGFRKSGDKDNERRCLEKALAVLARCPFPSRAEKWLCGWEFARHLMDSGNPAQAEVVLQALPEMNDTTTLRQDCALVACRAALGKNPDEVLDRARLCLHALAERMRVRDHVPLDAVESLAKAFEQLGDQNMAASLKRQEEALRERTGKPG